MYVGNIFLIMCLDMYKNLKEIGIIQEDVSKLIIFVNLWVSKLSSSLH